MSEKNKSTKTDESAKRVDAETLRKMRGLHSDLSRKLGALKVLQAEAGLAQAKMENATREALIAINVHENARVNLDTGDVEFAPATERPPGR